MSGFITVRKVAGNFHVAAGQAFGMADGHLAYQLSPQDFATFNASHTIHSISFGPKYRGLVAPLDGTRVIHTRGLLQHQYHIKAVPTLVEPLYGSIIDTHQFTATDFVNAPDTMNGAMVQPGVWFRYDFSPIMVRLVETRDSFLTFLVSVCAILGGVFTLSGLVDQVVFRAIDSAKNK